MKLSMCRALPIFYEDNSLKPHKNTEKEVLVFSSLLWGEGLWTPHNSHVDILTPKGDGNSKWGLWDVINSQGYLI